jgi:hypothetical protein
VLLQAAAEAGNLQTWRQLLLRAANDGQQQQQQSDLPVFDWPCLPLGIITCTLSAILRTDSSSSSTSSQQQQWQAAEDACRLQMADLLWQQLVVQQGREAALRQYLYTGLSEESEFMCIDMLLWNGASPLRALWLLQHQLPPPQDSRVNPSQQLWPGIDSATGAGDFARALELYNAAKAAPQGPAGLHFMMGRVQTVLQQCISGHLRRACAAGDAAAAAQLERLVCFADNAFAATEVSRGSSNRRSSRMCSSASCVWRLACAAKVCGEKSQSAGTSATSSCKAFLPHCKAHSGRSFSCPAHTQPELERTACCHSFSHVATHFARHSTLCLILLAGNTCLPTGSSRQTQIGALKPELSTPAPPLSLLHHCCCCLQLDLRHPLLLRTLLGDFHGRAVTMGSLAEELGLPWQLLMRLFEQHIDHRQCQDASQQELHQLRYKAAQSIGLGQDPEYQAQALSRAAGAALAGEVARLLRLEAELLQQVVGDQAVELQALQQHLQQLQQLEQQQQEQIQQLQEQGVVDDDGAGIDNEAGPPAEFPAAVAAWNPGNAAQQDAADQQQQQQHQQLQARLDAGERSIPQPQQVQLGPLPLWQQCVLEIASSFGRVDAGGCLKQKGGLYATMTTGLLVADSEESGSAAGVTTPLQRLLGSEEFVTGPPVAPQPARLPWGRLVAQAAVELRQPQLLAWALQPEQQQQLWGSSEHAVAEGVLQLYVEACHPFRCQASRHLQQQLQDLRQLQQHWQQQLPGRPAFAQQMGDVAVLLLDVAQVTPDLLGGWLEQGLRHNSSSADVERAKAVLAAVAAAKEIPGGASHVHKEALMRVLDTSDVDLLALFMCWANRAHVA